MEPTLFYTDLAEWSKALLYLPLALLILAGIWKRRRGFSGWANWIHAAVLIHFLIGGVYSGLRMLTTDPFSDMIVRRIFACEAWFCFACAAFYFVCMLFLDKRNQRPPSPGD